MLDPSVPGFIEDPHPLYRRLRVDDPVHWSEKLRAWALTRYAHAETFFRGPALTTDTTKAARFRGPERTGTARTLRTDGPGYASLRTLASRFLTAREVEPLRPRVAAVVEGLLDRVDAGEGFDLIRDFAFPLPLAVIADLLGVADDARDGLLEWSRRTAAGMDHVFSQRSEPAPAPRVDLHAEFLRMIRERRAEPREDLVSKLVSVRHEGDSLTDQEIATLCGGLLFAGHETTTNLIGNGTLSLLRHPDAFERVLDGDVSARSTVEELLRYESPAHALSRVALEDVDIEGKTIRKGDVILGVLGAMNRDPDAFEDAEGLRLDRSPNPHVAFGEGTHFCWGAPLSRLEGTVAIPALVRRFPKMRLAAEPVWRRTLVLRGLDSLPLAVA